MKAIRTSMTTRLYAQRKGWPLESVEVTLHHQRVHGGVGQNVELLGHGKPPVERHQHRAQPRTGIEQHQEIGMIGRDDRDAIAARDAELPVQGAGRLLDARAELGIGECCAQEADRRLLGRR